MLELVNVRELRIAERDVGAFTLLRQASNHVSKCRQ